MFVRILNAWWVVWSPVYRVLTEYNQCRQKYLYIYDGAVWRETQHCRTTNEWKDLYSMFRCVLFCARISTVMVRHMQDRCCSLRLSTKWKQLTCFTAKQSISALRIGEWIPDGATQRFDVTNQHSEEWSGSWHSSGMYLHSKTSG